MIEYEADANIPDEVFLEDDDMPRRALERTVYTDDAHAALHVHCLLGSIFAQEPIVEALERRYCIITRQAGKLWWTHPLSRFMT